MKYSDFVVGKKYTGYMSRDVLLDEDEKFKFTVLAQNRTDVIGFLHGIFPDERQRLKDLQLLQLRAQEYLDGKHGELLRHGEETDEAIVCYYINKGKLLTWNNYEVKVPEFDYQVKVPALDKVKKK